MYCGVPRIDPAMVADEEKSEGGRMKDEEVSGFADGSDDPAAGPSSSSFILLPSSFSPSTFARPQSITSTSPYSPTMMLSGFKSRWITLRLWANPIASQTFWKMLRSCVSGYLDR